MDARVPTWIDRSLLDADVFYLPSDCHPVLQYPPGAVLALEEAAAGYVQALGPPPITQTERALLTLRSGTIPRDETGAEARMSFELLKAGVADVPLDVLEEACRNYMRTAGQRFFPRSAGELRVFTDPILNRRRARAARLKAMADDAQRQINERRRRAAEDTSWSPELVDAANVDFRRAGIKTRYRYTGGGRCETFMLQPGDPEPEPAETKRGDETAAPPPTVGRPETQSAR